MEYCGGGDLFDKITSQKDGQQFSETKAASIMQKLFLGINHCHSNGVVHRDLKPENIMYKDTQNANESLITKESVGKETLEVNIIDFGLSKLLQNLQKGELKTLVGTPYYVAPEVLSGQYSKECDCWSLGVIMYAILSGCLPFYGNTPKEVFDRIRNAKINFELKEFRGISDLAKDLIEKLLCRDKKLRYSCLQALSHPWFEEAKTNTIL